MHLLELKRDEKVTFFDIFPFPGIGIVWSGQSFEFAAQPVGHLADGNPDCLTKLHSDLQLPGFRNDSLFLFDHRPGQPGDQLLRRYGQVHGKCGCERITNRV